MTAAHNRVRLKHLAQVRSSNVDKVIDDDQTPVRLCNYVDVYCPSSEHSAQLAA